MRKDCNGILFYFLHGKSGKSQGKKFLLRHGNPVFNQSHPLGRTQQLQIEQVHLHIADFHLM
jgi:hypothetical protein